MINELKESNVSDNHQFTILADFVTLPLMMIHWYVGSLMLMNSLAVIPNGGYDSGKCGSLEGKCVVGLFGQIK